MRRRPASPPSSFFGSELDPLIRAVSLLRRCASARSVKQVHAFMLASAVFRENSLLFRLVELGDRDYASAQFGSISNPDCFAFNVMIRGLATTWADYPSALELYRDMIRSGERPDNYTYPFVLTAAGNLQWRRHGGSVHSSAFKSGHQSDSHTQHSLVTMYARSGEICSARQVFDELSERDLVSWNSMISGYSRIGLARDAVETFRIMRRAGFEPDDMTLVSVAAGCGDLGDIVLGQKLEAMAAARGSDLNSFLGCAFVSMYGKCGDLEAARRVFDQMTRKHLITWNAMISAFSQNGMAKEAISVFKEMKDSGTEPNEVTMVAVLSACGATGDIALGQWMDSLASEKGLLGDVYVGTALVDMHAKSGNLDRAVQEALSLFSRMREEKTVQPNDITFVGVLTACVHAGLVEEGRRWFNSMAEDFGVAPQIEHSSCMVDLLARAACLEEAWEFIENMPEKPDAIVLGALLAACRIRKNVEIGERVMHRLLELEPNNSGNYVISSKLYAESRRWEDSARIRGLMRERGVAKTPGCSWIQVGGRVNEFRSGDGLHPESVELQQALDALSQEMKLEGYVPNADLS